ncbi:hypothetical protein C6P46_005706 [Rhodotorula mucilaginosa]|uniref:Uncharacterized protein n=1 Tax=Rhodotorula mucilaginosa TaxID=5537 RepID=A0A9P7B4C4_RHOMI|nr:hypothetical protein C6P46_005706 [Rhodotorula mucilaginosa]TKA51213.1 hypothetical protein B0A53_05789 [Rhodotorula sp. CCFEE 5036]
MPTTTTTTQAAQTTTTTQSPAQPTTTPAQSSSSPAQSPTTTSSPPAQQTTTAQPTTTTSQPAQDQTTTTSPATATTTSEASASDPTTTTTDGTTTTPSASPSASNASNAAAADSSRSSASSASAAASSASGSTSLVTLTYTSTFTNADGSIGTSTGTLTSASVVPIQNNSGSSNTAKTWGIVGGVVGGVAVITALVFLIYRMTQRRFLSLDGDDIDDIKWPDLLPDGQEISSTTSTLMPLSTHRTNGAGVGDDGMTEYGGGGGDIGFGGGSGGGSGDGVGGGGVYAPLTADGRRSSSATLLSQRTYPDPYAPATSYADHSRQASYEHLAMADGGAEAFARGYDPFVGRTGPLSMSPPPPLPPLPQQQGMVYPPSPPQYQLLLQHFAGAPAAIPRGAPGAAGAARIASPPPSRPQSQSPPTDTRHGDFYKLPSIRRTESPLAVPGLGIVDPEKGPL